MAPGGKVREPVSLWLATILHYDAWVFKKASRVGAVARGRHHGNRMHQAAYG